MRVELLDHGYVQLIESWGSDERIIESARMSTDKGFQGWGGARCEVCVSAGRLSLDDGLFKTQEHRGAAHNCACKGTGVTIGDEKLLKYLYEHKHTTPFEMGGLTIEVQAPIFVFREWHRHRTQSYSELSARYTPLPDIFYLPSIDRIQQGAQSTTNKQGSADSAFTFGQAQMIRGRIEKAYTDARKDYEALLASGVAREIARLVIPVAQYSRMRASANLLNWLRFLTLRMAPNAQWEIRQFANTVGDMVGQAFPRTWELFVEGRYSAAH